MADSMVEAVARAISHECPNGCEAAGEIDACRPDLCDCRRIARAAIAAMREPTEAMLMAALDSMEAQQEETENILPIEVWRAMIDAALAE